MPTILDFICPDCGHRFGRALDGKDDEFITDIQCPGCGRWVSVDADPLDLAEEFINRNIDRAKIPITGWEKFKAMFEETEAWRLGIIVFLVSMNLNAWFDRAYWDVLIHATAYIFILTVTFCLFFDISMTIADALLTRRNRAQAFKTKMLPWLSDYFKRQRGG